MNLLQKNKEDYKWIYENFPENIQSMFYVDVDFHLNSLFLNKEKSKEECLNVSDIIFKFIQNIRDNSEEFIKIIENENYFEDYFTQNLLFQNQLHESVYNFLKYLVDSKIIKKDSIMKKDFLEKIIQYITFLKNRLNDCYLINKTLKEIVINFSDDNNILYFNCPSITEENMQIYIELAAIFKKNKSKIMIHSHPSVLYNKLFKEWTCKINTNNKNKIESIWINY